MRGGDIMDTKVKYFLGAGSIGRNRNWGFVEFLTPKRIYRQAKDAIAKHGTKNVILGFSDLGRIESIIVKF